MAAPTMIQHVSGSSTQGTGVTAYKLTFPYPVLAGNAIVVDLGFDTFSTPTVTITDDAPGASNVYAQVVTNTGNSRVARTYVAVNATAGAQVITIAFSVLTSNVTGNATEYNNIVTTSVAAATDVTGVGSGISGTAATGVMTTTVAGDLIHQFVYVQNGPLTSFTQGASPFISLSTDVLDAHAAQFQVQAAAGAITPSMGVAPATAAWNTVAVALKSATAGTARPAGIRIIRIQHEAFPAGQGLTTTLQWPCEGNLLAVSAIMEPTHDITALSSSPVNTWTSTGAAFGALTSGDNQLYFAATPSVSTALTLTVTKTGSDITGSTLMLLDIVGAANAPLDGTRQTASGNQTVGNSLTGVSITPTTSNGLVLTSFAIDAGTTLTGSPGRIYMFSTTPHIPGSPIDQQNGWIAYQNPNTSPISFSWTCDAPPGNWANIAVAFKAAAGTPPTAGSSFFSTLNKLGHLQHLEHL